MDPQATPTIPLDVRGLPAFSDNYLWLLTDSQRQAIAIDPGDADVVQNELDRAGLTLRAILITHHHPDHIGGAAALRARHGCPIHAPDDPRIDVATHRTGEGETLTFGSPSIEFRVMHLPGHTRSHIAFLGQDAVFVGDTLFGAGCGRLFEGSAEQMLHSLDRLAALPVHTRIFCAHEYTRDNARFALEWEPGNADLQRYYQEAGDRYAESISTIPSTVGVERRVNPFLRCHQPEIRRRVEQVTGVSLPTRLDVFTALREMKNRYVPCHLAL